MSSRARPVGLGRPSGDFLSRLRARALDPVNLAVPLVIPIICLVRSSGLISDVPYWVIVVLLLGAQGVNTLFAALMAEATTGWRLWARVGMELGVIAVVAYGIGWGPMLGIGFVFGAADAIRVLGARAAVPAMVWTVVVIGLGQLAIATGLAPTVVSQPLVQGLGALGALGAVLTIKVLEWFAKVRESSESRFKALVQHASDIIIVTDNRGRLAYVSPAFDRLLGYSTVGLDTRSAAELMHPDDRSAMRSLAPHWNKGSDQVTQAEVRLRQSDGEWRWFEASVTNHLADPNVRGIVGNLHDITERKSAEEALREAHERFRSAFVNAPIGMAIVDLEGRIVRANSSYGRILGHSSDTLAGMSLHDLIHLADRESSAAEMRRLISSRSDGYQIEKRFIHSYGHEVWVSVSVSCVRDAEAKPLYMIGQIEDVTDRRTLRERLAHAAIHDPLTGLPNRVLFMDRLEVALSRAKRQGRRVAVAFLDIDRFKLVNDSMGHDSGDRLLVAVAGRLRAALRVNDTVARLGGDEFTVLCEEVSDDASALEAAERLVDALRHPFDLVESEVFVTASLGLAVSGSPGDSPSSLLRDADTAMYVAKERGRARIELFDQENHEVALQRMHISTELHRALERGELCVYYQPIVELNGGRLAGMEALLRWQHPERGLLPAGEFLRMAEDSGLIVAIGDWVLDQACRQYVSWESERSQRGAGNLSVGMCVNLSPRQLAEPDFVDQVEDAIQSSGIDPRALCLEITEGALIGDAESTLDVLHDLRALGVRLSIDDFGSGYSSLAYLRSFPVEVVKIDRSFVEGLGHEAGDATIVQSVVALARSLGLLCIAEGVENRQQLNKLRALGCAFAQGFLLGVPLSPATLGSNLTDDLSSWAVDSSGLFGLAKRTA